MTEPTHPAVVVMADADDLFVVPAVLVAMSRGGGRLRPCDRWPVRPHAGQELVVALQHIEPPLLVLTHVVLDGETSRVDELAVVLLDGQAAEVERWRRLMGES
jgi:hypothetical protein